MNTKSQLVLGFGVEPQTGELFNLKGLLKRAMLLFWASFLVHPTGQAESSLVPSLSFLEKADIYIDAYSPLACVPSSCASNQCLNGHCVLNLGSGHHALSGRDYELLGLPHEDGSFTYVQWFPAVSAANNAAVIVANPYDGIDWTPESVDQWWAQNNPNPGCYEDIHEPDYAPGMSAPICYLGTKDPDGTAIQVYGFLINDVSVLITFGRFYAGMNLGAPVEGVSTGIEYLANIIPNYDPSRTAVFGISLGGFEVLHGAANVPQSIRPKVGVGVAPLLDLSRFYVYANQTLPVLLEANPTKLNEYNEFFDPYLRRMVFTAGNLAQYSIDSLSNKLNGDFLVLHDHWDTLVPVQSSLELVGLGVAEGIWNNHATPIDIDNFTLSHWQDNEGLGFLLTRMFSYSYIMNHIASAGTPITVVYDYTEFLNFIIHVRGRQMLGDDISWLVPRLIEIANARVQLVDLNDSTYNAPGYHLIGLFLNGAWDARLNPATFSTDVIPYLKEKGLPLKKEITPLDSGKPSQ